MRKRCITRSTESSSWTALTRAFCRGHSQVAKRGPKTEAELQRFSGREYTNSLEKLEAIKEKYKGGVRPEHVEALVEAWLKRIQNATTFVQHY